MSTAIVWFRLDLRVHDNPALLAASRRHERIVPVYIHTPTKGDSWANGDASRWWLHHSLASLSDMLSSFGSGLCFCLGEPHTELLSVARETAAYAVYWNRRYEPVEAANDNRIKQSLQNAGIQVETYRANLLLEPSDVKTSSGRSYSVFSPFWKRSVGILGIEAGRGQPPLSPKPWKPALCVRHRFHTLTSMGLLPRGHWQNKLQSHWVPGSEGAQERLDDFLRNSVIQYPRRRDLLADGTTSHLSPHLHFGEISPHQILWRLKPFLSRQSGDAAHVAAECFLRQLGWREFAHHLLHHRPELPERPFRVELLDFPWRCPGEYAKDLIAWQTGRTGIPLVDAGMRELWQTGWMHNRARMIVACFLTKNLLIPWQEGARWFWSTLVDADLANNTVGWQWAAGCGPDAAPYFRIFNPVTQARRFDPHGHYIRRWVPELATVPDGSVFTPWMTDNPPPGYPKPIVDLAASRRRALETYAQFKQDQRSRRPGP